MPCTGRGGEVANRQQLSSQPREGMCLSGNRCGTAFPCPDPSRQPVKVTAPGSHLPGLARVVTTPPRPRRARAQEDVFSVQGSAEGQAGWGTRLLPAHPLPLLRENSCCPGSLRKLSASQEWADSTFLLNPYSLLETELLSRSTTMACPESRPQMCLDPVPLDSGLGRSPPSTRGEAMSSLCP